MHDEVPIRLRIEPLEEGGFVATSPDVPGLVAQGRTLEETVEIARGLVHCIVEVCLDHGEPPPPAFAGRGRDSFLVGVEVAMVTERIGS